MSHDAFIYDAIRTPRGKGKPGGGLYEVKPIDLVTNLLEEMKARHDLDTTRVEDFVCATGEPVKEQGQNIAKTALVYSSWDDVTVGAQLHRYCAGGLDAVNTVAMKLCPVWNPWAWLEVSRVCRAWVWAPVALPRVIPGCP